MGGCFLYGSAKLVRFEVSVKQWNKAIELMRGSLHVTCTLADAEEYMMSNCETNQ